MKALSRLAVVSVLISALASSSCNSSSDSESASGGTNHPFEGTWSGTVNCDATVDDNGAVSSESGPSSLSFVFDDSGDMVLVLGGSNRSLEEQGQEITTQESDGSILVTTVNVRSVSNTSVSYTVGSVSDKTQADTSSNFSIHAVQSSAVQMTLGSDTSKATVTFSSESDETTTFSTSFGGGVTQKLTQVTCTGELSKSR